MKKLFLLTAILAISFQTLCAQKLTFVPQWTAQSQFAGFYMALEKGFYADEGLDVTIEHMGINSTISVEDKLYLGEAQIVGRQLTQSVISRSDGRPLVNVLQLLQNSSLCCVSHDEITVWKNLEGKKVAKWKAGFSEIGDILDMKTQTNVTWVPCISPKNIFIYEAVDAALCYSYSELIDFELSLGEVPESHILYVKDLGCGYPEDGLYVTEKYYKNNRETIDKFIKASKKGWDYAEKNVDETLDVCMRICRENHVVTTRSCQRKMLATYLKLMINPVSGLRDYSKPTRQDFDNLVNALYETGCIIVKPDYDDMIK